MMGRVALGAAGVALIGFGAFRLLTEIPEPALVGLAIWLAVAVVLHDGVLAPVVALVGAAVNRLVPPRLRRYVSGALGAGAGISIITVPLALRQGTQPAAKALLQQRYAVHLAWLWAVIGALAALLYVARVVRDARRPS
jgi:hypothetical protein